MGILIASKYKIPPNGLVINVIPIPAKTTVKAASIWNPRRGNGLKSENLSSSRPTIKSSVIAIMIPIMALFKGIKISYRNR